MRFCWVTINVRDMEESLRFYRDVLGLRVNRSMKPMPGTEIAFLGEGSTEVELIRNERNNDPSFGKDISIGFEVSSVDEEIERLKGMGIRDIQGPFSPNPRIKFIYLLDPNGVRVQLVQNS